MSKGKKENGSVRLKKEESSEGRNEARKMVKNLAEKFHRSDSALCWQYCRKP
jgi:hypothetical protein